MDGTFFPLVPSLLLNQRSENYGLQPNVAHHLFFPNPWTKNDFYVFKWLKKSKEYYLMIWKLHEIQPPVSIKAFWNPFIYLLSIAAFTLQRPTLVVTETIWPAKLKILSGTLQMFADSQYAAWYVQGKSKPKTVGNASIKTKETSRAVSGVRGEPWETSWWPRKMDHACSCCINCRFFPLVSECSDGSSLTRVSRICRLVMCMNPFLTCPSI